MYRPTRYLSNRTALLVGCLTLAALLNAGFGLQELGTPETFLFVPFDPGDGNLTEDLLATEVDRLVFYATDGSCRETGVSHFRRFVDQGKNVSLVLTTNVTDDSNISTIYGWIAGNISYFNDESRKSDITIISEYILFDDPLSTGAYDKKNRIASWTRANFTEARLGIILDMRTIVGIGQNRTDDLYRIKYDHYDFFCGYYFSYLPPMDHPLYDVAGNDPGELSRLNNAIDLCKDIAKGKETWFVLRAHRQEPDKMTSDLLMFFDLLTAKMKDLDSIGWFTMDESDEGEVIYFGDSENWRRKSLQESLLLELAKEPTYSDVSDCLISILDQHARDLSEKIDILQTKLEELNGSLSTNTDKLNGLISDLANLDNAVDVFRVDIDSLVGETQKVRESTLDLVAKVYLLSQNISDLGSRLNRTVIEQVETLKEITTAISNETTTLRSELKEAMDVQANLATQLRDLSKDLGLISVGLTSDLEDLNMTIGAIRKVIVSQTQRIDETAEELNDQISHILDQQTAEFSETRDLIAGLDDQIEEKVNRIRDGMQTELDDLRRRQNRDLSIAAISLAAAVFLSNIMVLASIRKRRTDN